MFDKTSGEQEVYDIQSRGDENGRTMIYTVSRKTNLRYKFTIIDKKVSTFYDYDIKTDTYRSALMFHN
jgi:hypothetical protein